MSDDLPPVPDTPELIAVDCKETQTSTSVSNFEAEENAIEETVVKTSLVSLPNMPMPAAPKNSMSLQKFSVLPRPEADSVFELERRWSQATTASCNSDPKEPIDEVTSTKKMETDTKDYGLCPLLAQIVLVICAIIKLVVFVGLFVLFILILSGNISSVVGLLKDEEKSHNSTTTSNADFIKQVKDKSRLIIGMVCALMIAISLIIIIVQIIGLAGIKMIKPMFLSILLVTDIVLLILLIFAIYGAAYLRSGASDYPQKNAGFFNYIAAATLVGKRLFSSQTLQSSEQMLDKFGKIQTEKACCGWNDFHDWWKQKVTLPETTVFGQKIESVDLQIPDTWVTACFWSNSADPREPRKVCYVPNSCCTQNDRNSEISMRLLLHRAITCGDSNLTIVMLPPDDLENYVRVVKDYKYTVLPLHEEKINQKGCVGPIVQEFGIFMKHLAIVSVMVFLVTLLSAILIILLLCFIGHV